MKKILSLVLAFVIVLGAIPIGDMVALAADGDPKVTGVEVIKTYSGINKVKATYIQVTGNNLNKRDGELVVVKDKDGEPKVLTTKEETPKRLYYKVDDMDGISIISVDSEDYDISGEKIPSISRINPDSGIVKNNEIMTITGNGFKELNDDANGKITFYNNTGKAENTGVNITENEIIKTFSDTSPGGAYRLEFSYTDKKYTIPSFTLKENYPDLFTVHGKLGVSNDIIIVPNQGPKGTIVKIIGENLLDTDKMSVFFVKTIGGSNSYTISNMGTDETYTKNAEKAKETDENPTLDVFTVKVPDLGQGSYHVVLTNNVNEGVDPAGKITSVKQLDDMFTVVDNADTILVQDVNPDRGPETGIDTTIQGRYIGSLSKNIFAPNDNSELIINNGSIIDTSSNTLELAYKPKVGTGVIGKYKLIGGTEGVDVKEIIRKITVYIGGKATFREGSSFTDSVDKLEIRVPSVSIPEGENREKEVTVEVETIIKYVGMDKPLKINESGKWIKEKDGKLEEGKFIFDPISYRPEIESITPMNIPVDEKNEIINGLEIHITGKNFFTHRYTDKEDKKVKLKKPVINLGNQVILDPNISVETTTDGIKRVPILSEDMKVLDGKGNIIEGTPTNNLGTKISVKIPTGVKISDEVLNQASNLLVINPIKNDENINVDEPNKHLGLSASKTIKFIKVGQDDTPTIIDVNPKRVPTEGEKGVKISGTKFRPGVKVYLDGEEIKGVERGGTNKELTFNAPPKPVGFYQIIVQNEEEAGGGLVVFNDFEYIKLETDIRISGFNPKKGTANTLVTIKGKNLLPPNPLVLDISRSGIYKLIGTRVLLGGEDVNKYHMEEDKITLQDYISSLNDEIVRIEDNRVKLSDYYHSIILEQDGERKKYYTIFFDTNTGEIKLTDGDKEVYIIDKKGEGIGATKNGVSYDMEIKKDSIVIKDKITLKIRTPYAIGRNEIIKKDNQIVGNRVKVISNGELVFEVPSMPREGLYDLTVVNPDSGKDSKVGNNGFYYSFQPEFNPIITDIKPNEGSVDGQYYINISGEGFIDRGNNGKTAVIIGTEIVDPKDITVSPDGKSLKVKVPKYPGDLASETKMDRKSVAVVVVNPDGGSASEKEGFTYIIPISHPVIEKLILNSGSAAGGESVIIEGKDFRFFEPYKDVNNNSQWDTGEPFTDLNENKVDKEGWDDLRYWRSPQHKLAYEELVKDYEKLVRPILPKVYFGGKEVEIIDFTANTIEVKTPKGNKGNTEVQLVNNDYGTSNKMNFNYNSSNPKITSITPSVGRKQGRDKVEILGDGFHQSKIKVIKDLNTTVEQTLPVVQFGKTSDPNISNKDIPIDAIQNSGKISGSLSTVKVGNLTIRYDATGDKAQLNFKLTEGVGSDQVEYELNNVNYDNGEIYLPLSLLKDKKDSKKSYGGYEYVKIILEKVTGAISTNRVRIDRGFSPHGSLKNPGHISVETPSYYTIGTVPVTIINPDTGTATTNFEYKNPDSNPIIENILKDDDELGYDVDGGIRVILDVNYSGGNIIKVLGKDFRKPVKITMVPISGAEGLSPIEIPESSITYLPEGESVSNKLIFDMPVVEEKYVGAYLRMVVTNQDGGSASSEPIEIHFTKPESTNLEITKITPNFGPTVGGTTITIEGKDFRKNMDGKGELKVYFGKAENLVLVPQSDILSISFDKIVLKTPPYTAGITDVKVQNPDGNIVILKDGFNYVSNPKITSVVNPENEKFVIEVISIEGGEKIKILGSDFMEGARVVFNPVLKLVEDDKQATGDIITIDDRKYILESGVEGTEVERINGQTITVTTPQGKLGDKGVIVINPDKGATNMYNVIYGIPEIGAPFNVRAELVFDQFIRVNWTGVKEATQYEIYMSEDGGKFEFIDTTELTSYAVQKLKPNRKYQFLVKAMGKYGTSKPIEESKSRVVKTGSTIGPIDDDGKPADKTETKVNGTTADIIIGAKDFTTKGMTIDLTRGNLAGVKDITIRIPASVVSRSLGKIQVIGKDYRMEFAPSIFKTSTIEDNKSKSNVGVVFKISTHKDNIDVKSGDTIVGGRYNLEAVVYVDKNLSKIDYINGKLNFTLDQDPLIIKNRRLTNIKTVRYDNSTKTWIEATTPNRLGLYTVIGSRR